MRFLLIIRMLSNWESKYTKYLRGNVVYIIFLYCEICQFCIDFIASNIKNHKFSFPLKKKEKEKKGEKNRRVIDYFINKVN